MTNRGPIHDLLPGWEPWKRRHQSPGELSL